MSRLISYGIRKASKPHRCFHCYRRIPNGEVYTYETCVADHIYTLHMHTDCDRFSAKYMKDFDHHYCDFDNGYPPIDDLIDETHSTKERAIIFNKYRGFYPHVITRLEHNQQDSDIRYANYRKGVHM